MSESDTGFGGVVCVLLLAVENRVQRTEHIIMGTSGTVLDWILKRKVCVFI